MVSKPGFHCYRLVEPCLLLSLSYYKNLMAQSNRFTQLLVRRYPRNPPKQCSWALSGKLRQYAFLNMGYVNFLLFSLSFLEKIISEKNLALMLWTETLMWVEQLENAHTKRTHISRLKLDFKIVLFLKLFWCNNLTPECSVEACAMHEYRIYAQ